MYSYISSDIFAKDADPFFADFRKDFGFLYLRKGGLLYKIFGKDAEVRPIHKDDFPVIENLISKHFSDNIYFSNQQNISEFSRWICIIFSYISNYYCCNPQSRENSYAHLGSFFMMVANYFQYEYEMTKARNGRQERLYRDKHGNIINWGLNTDPNSLNDEKWQKLSYKNVDEIIARDARERILHWFQKLPKDQETEELIHIVIPILPPQLKSIIEPLGSSSL